MEWNGMEWNGHSTWNGMEWNGKQAMLDAACAVLACTNRAGLAALGERTCQRAINQQKGRRLRSLATVRSGTSRVTTRSYISSAKPSVRRETTTRRPTPRPRWQPLSGNSGSASKNLEGVDTNPVRGVKRPMGNGRNRRLPMPEIGLLS